MINTFIGLRISCYNYWNLCNFSLEIRVSAHINPFLGKALFNIQINKLISIVLRTYVSIHV